MIFRHQLRLHADPARVVIRPFHLAWQAQDAEPARARSLVEAVMALDTRTVRAELGLVFRDFETRHWQTRDVFMARFAEVEAQVGLKANGMSAARKELIGAYFCHEYSYAAAALMNPSVVPHPDQTGLMNGACRILLSLRAVGEGHISSIAFREGVVSPAHELQLMPEPPFATAAEARPAKAIAGGGPVTVRRHPKTTLSGTVIFPVTEAQRHGLEDLRTDPFRPSRRRDGMDRHLHRLFGCRDPAPRCCAPRDFKSFRLLPMTGIAAQQQGASLCSRARSAGATR